MSKKIIWYVQRLEQVGGGERFALESVLALKGKGVDAQILCDALSEKASFNGLYDLSAVKSLGSSQKFGDSYFFIILSKIISSIKLFWYLARNRPEMVIVQSEPDAVKMYLISRILRFKYRVFLFGQMFQFAADRTKYSRFFIQHCQKIIESRPGYKSIIPWPAPRMSFVARWINDIVSYLKLKTMQAADQLFTLSEQVKWEASLLYQREARVLVGAFRESFIDKIRVAQHRPMGTTFRVVSVCRLVPKKRVGIIIRGVDLYDGDIQLNIVGTGPEEEALKQIASKMRHPERVKFLGAVTDEVLEQTLCEGDCFISMDIGDYDISVIEALAKGLKAAVATDFDETIFEGQFRGIEFLQPDPEVVAKNLQKLRLSTVDTQNNLKILKKFTWENLAKNIVAQEEVAL